MSCGGFSSASRLCWPAPFRARANARLRTDRQGRRAVGRGARKGDAAAVKKLLDEGVDVNTKFRYDRTALSFAADRGHVDVVKVLLERGADINAKDTFYNATPLTWTINPAMERKPIARRGAAAAARQGGHPRRLS